MSRGSEETQSDMDAAHALQGIRDNLRAQEPVGELGMLPNVAEALAHVSISVDNIARGLITTEPHEGERRTVADGLHVTGTGLHRIADALEELVEVFRVETFRGAKR